jgi:hypothetical protein
MRVTPERAAKWLERNTINRPLSDSRVTEIADAITSGQWRGDNSETIKISPEGDLVDGQHRLWGVVMANQAVYMLVAFGVPKDTFATIDIGGKRTAAHAISVLKKQGGPEYKYANQLASAAKWIHRFSDVKMKKLLMGPGSFRVTNTQVLAAIEANPEIVESTYFICSLPHVKGINRAKMIFLHTLFGKKHSDKANEFFEKLYTGEELTRGSPILALRNKLLSLVGHTGSINGHPYSLFVLVITIKAWNVFRKGGTAKVLSWGEKEKPPTPR